MPIGHRILTCLAQGGYKPPVSGGLFNLFQMSQQEEDVLSLEDSGSEYLFHLPSRITPKDGPKYSLIIMLGPPHFINSLLYVFRSDIRGITPGLFICCPLA